MKEFNGYYYQCYCCGHFTLSEARDNSFDICPVCFWEDDGVQSDNPHYEGGANVVSLNVARKNYKKFGASEFGFLDNIRKPNSEEM
ncbi:hydrolase [Mucilaginibacter limnophilus]|uniref:Hydrolase n=1 Tax=Mucilaginibacter limnophilus TaxID=1932778 RepID=A0A3S2UKN3_9SPHI|nr:CPCC family cysteine-rich protein [Mucilaginibacter limnophilus]RVU00513.1 hydrolase [Mucilaginibacter limnophilus]